MGEFIIYRPDLLKRLAVFAVIAIIAAIGLNIRWHYVYLAYNFNGRVDSVRYGDKGTAIIIIKGKEFILDDKWSNDRNIPINKEDSMIKLKDSTWVKLIRPNGITIVR